MLTSEQIIIIDAINATTKTISVQKQVIIKNDDVIIAMGAPERRAFVPGEIEEVKLYTGWDDTTPEIIYLNSIWTQEVINEWNLQHPQEEVQ